MENFYECHKVITLPSLRKGDKVWIPEFETSGTVMEETHPRSYRVHSGGIRDLISLPNESDPQDKPTPDNAETQSRESDGGVTRSGRVSKPPDRLVTVSNNCDRI